MKTTELDRKRLSVMLPHEKLISFENYQFAFRDELRSNAIYDQRIADEERKARKCRLS